MSAIQWNGEQIVAYRGTDRIVRMNRATGFDGPSGRLVGWASTPTIIATDVDSQDIQLAPMYVLTTKGFPASHGADVNSELLALFYTSGTGSSAVHKYRYATPGDPFSWSAARDVIGREPGSSTTTALIGDVAPGVAVWPSRSGVGGANSYRDIGYACGLFPRRLVMACASCSPPTTDSRDMDLYCYDKAQDTWTRNTEWSSNNLGRKPAFAFHALRTAGGPAIDDRRGQFWGGISNATGYLTIAISEEVSHLKPPLSVAGSPQLAFHRPESTWETDSRTGVSLYGDRDISALKALALYRYGNPVATRLALQGLFDGSHQAELKDGNDFHVMEHGICRGLHPASASTEEERRWCCKAAVTDKCVGSFNLDL